MPNELEVRQRQMENELRVAAEESARIAQRKAEEEVKTSKDPQRFPGPGP